MPQVLQVTKITKNGRISLGRAMSALDVEEGDLVQLYDDGNGKVCMAKLKAPAQA
ncbi:MAG: AbrB/MazE/SpoVT family DNA-binding domain-containing protein [Methanomassiliicoccales archaeon]|nr:MAG: AbrB/MazE/SpoVT family DNA-binding domain-containing protein [Methanomassiliicoccales archaeon]